jgi:hypothetical protein
MKRHLILLIALIFTFALAIPAMAEVDVTATVDKTKTVTVNEYINKYKSVDIDVTLDLNLNTAAESMAIVNQDNTDNNVPERNTTPLEPANTPKESWIGNLSGEDSIFDNDGITLLNQSSGNMDQQGNVVSAAVTESTADTGSGFAEAQASAEQNNDNNYVFEYQEFADVNYDFYQDLTTNVWYKLAVIANSINSNTGITLVNQSAGNMNNQMSAISLGVDIGGSLVALSEADLGQSNTSNIAYVYNTASGAAITASVNENRGITNVNQSAGNMNTQGIVISVAGGL